MVVDRKSIGERESKYERLGFLEDIGDEDCGVRARGAFGREEFGSEIPKHCHPYDSSYHLREPSASASTSTSTSASLLSLLLNLPRGLWRRHLVSILSDATRFSFSLERTECERYFFIYLLYKIESACFC